MNNKEKAIEIAAQKQKPAKKVRFKAGSELADKVNKANIIIDDFSDDEEFKIKVKLDFSNDEGETICFMTGSNRPRFKAGSDLTEKVNIMDVYVKEDATDSHDILEVSLVLINKQCGQPISIPA